MTLALVDYHIDFSAEKEGAKIMKTGLILLAIGLIMVLYFYITYKRSTQYLAEIKEEDLVSYYLDLFMRLLPVPFWVGLIGLAVIIVAIIIILVNIPWTI